MIRKAYLEEGGDGRSWLQLGAIMAGLKAEANAVPGLFVAGVVTGGPAALAGLRAGDVITKIDGKDATTNLQLQELTLTKKPGDTVPVEFTRDGKQASATVTLAAQP